MFQQVSIPPFLQRFAGRSRQRTLLCALVGAWTAFSPTAAGQGTDCTSAEPIYGIGVAYPLGVDGSSGWPITPSTCSNLNGVTADGYYQWTVPTNGDYLFDFDVPIAYRTLQVYQGFSCQATYLTCFSTNHSDWYQDLLITDRTAGQGLLFRGIGLIGEFTARLAGQPCSELTPDSFVGNNAGCASAAAIGNGYYPNLVAEGANPDHYSVCVAAGDTLELHITPGTYGDVSVSFRHASAPCTHISGTRSHEPFMASYSNGTGMDQQVIVVVRPTYSTKCLPYDLLITGAGGCGSPASTSLFCDPMDSNSTGASTTLTATTGTGIGSGIRLEAQQGPPGQFGSFLVGTGVTEPGLALGQGRFCLAIDFGQQIGRYNVDGSAMNSIGVFDASGVFQNVVGTSLSGLGFDVPSQVPTIGQTIQVGETWHFQMWHRDVNGHSNFSNGVSVTY